MNDGGIPPAVLDWGRRVGPGARVTGSAVRPLSGGSVARRVEQLTLYLADGHAPLELVRKDAPAHEIAGLRAAQVLRPQATAVPELVAAGHDWLILPMAPGTLLTWTDEVPGNLFDTLAALHARFAGDDGLPAVIPRVSPAWWKRLCLGWVLPGLAGSTARHPSPITARATALVAAAADLPAAASVLARLPATLLHGDVHPGNVVVTNVLPGPGRATLIDWGSCRVGPAALDLANLVTIDSSGVARYRQPWRRLTGRALPGGTLELGYRWAALQLPVQYLPWTAANRDTGDVEAVLDRIEGAIAGVSGDS